MILPVVPMSLRLYFRSCRKAFKLSCSFVTLTTTSLALERVAELFCCHTRTAIGRSSRNETLSCVTFLLRKYLEVHRLL